MKLFLLTFTGREVRAIGAFQDFRVILDAESEEAARLKIYDTHEHLSNLRVVKILPATENDPEHPARVSPLCLSCGKGKPVGNLVCRACYKSGAPGGFVPLKHSGMSFESWIAQSREEAK